VFIISFVADLAEFCRVFKLHQKDGRSHI